MIHKHDIYEELLDLSRKKIIHTQNLQIPMLEVYKCSTIQAHLSHGIILTKRIIHIT